MPDDERQRFSAADVELGEMPLRVPPIDMTLPPPENDAPPPEPPPPPPPPPKGWQQPG